MLFDFNQHSDELNLWYVAVTRAKRALFLPEKWVALDTYMRQTLDKNAEGNGEVLGLQELFKRCPLFASEDALLMEWLDENEFQ